MLNTCGEACELAISPSFDPKILEVMQPPPLRHPAPNVTLGTPASDSLQIVDIFTPSVGPPLTIPDETGTPRSMPTLLPAHGVDVTQGALDTGFRGAVNNRPAQMEPNVATPFLSSPMVQPGQMNQLLRDHARLEQAGILRTGSKALIDSLQASATQQVTNLSLGASSSNTVKHLYNDIRANWQPVPENETGEQRFGRERGRGVMNNLAAAWDIPVDSLNSGDPLISGPARQKFQQRLITEVSAAGDDPMVKEARTLYSKIVDDYESRNNSVVVSAGNDGGLLGLMREDNGGRELSTAKGFYDNPLAVPNVTTVGALHGTPGGVVVAPYSSPSEQVDVNAWGNLRNLKSGTSFAAPRVAAMMQRLHHENPQATSDEIQQMMIGKFFSTDAAVPSEREGVVPDYMKSQTW